MTRDDYMDPALAELRAKWLRNFVRPESKAMRRAMARVASSPGRRTAGPVPAARKVAR